MVALPFTCSQDGAGGEFSDFIAKMLKFYIDITGFIKIPTLPLNLEHRGKGDSEWGRFLPNRER